MIHLVLKDIVQRFNSFLLPQTSLAGKQMMLGDIAKHNGPMDTRDLDTIQNNLVLTLVSVEEENTLKNNYPIRQEQAVATTQKPTLYLNLYLLFTANFDDYEEALKHLGYVLLFFQVNTKISYTDTLGNTYQLSFTLHNVGFENLHNLWTVLGGVSKPSAVYKARLMFIQESPLNGAQVITQVESKESIS